MEDFRLLCSFGELKSPLSRWIDSAGRMSNQAHVSTKKSDTAHVTALSRDRMCFVGTSWEKKKTRTVNPSGLFCL